MKITAIKAQQKNPDRVSVFADGTYVFSLTIDQVLQTGLKRGIEIGQAELDTYKKLSADGKLKARTYEWLLGRPHSTKELRDYLRRKKVEPEQIDALVEDFTAKGVLSDERFAAWFASRGARKHKSLRVVTNELRSKGIDAQTAAEHVRGAVSDAESLLAMIEKLRTRPRYQDPARLMRYLQSKGFAYGDIKAAIGLTEPEQEP